MADLGKEEMAIDYLEPYPCSQKGHKNQVNARSVKETALDVDSTIEREAGGLAPDLSHQYLAVNLGKSQLPKIYFPKIPASPNGWRVSRVKEWP